MIEAADVIAWASAALLLAAVGYIPWRVIRDRRRQAQRVASADELGTRLMLEHGPISGAQMQLVWHGIHQVIAVHGALDAEQLRYLITEARNRQN